MKRYTKIITLKEIYFTKEFEKKKNHKNKVRQLKENTVAKNFLQGDTEILVYFEETDREVLITPHSDPKDIKKYLGELFIY